jgi:hypothetical protein
MWDGAGLFADAALFPARTADFNFRTYTPVLIFSDTRRRPKNLRAIYR